MKGFIESCELPADERVYLKKDRTGWRVVEPIIDPITGKRNYFAGWKKSVIPFLFILLIVSLFLYGYRESTKSVYSALNEILANPVDFCNSLTTQGVCKAEWRAAGLCLDAEEINISNVDLRRADKIE